VKELLATVDAWRSEGVGFGRAVLVRAFGSAPRPEGATLLAADDGRLAGSVSGGCVEGACVAEIHAARRTGLARVVRYGITDEQAWDVGLACGSTIDVMIEPELRPEVERAARAGAGTAVVIPLPDGAPGPADGPHAAASATPGTAYVVGSSTRHAEAVAPEPAVLEAAGHALAVGRSTTLALRNSQFFIEAFPIPPRLVVFGAVQVAIPLVRFARELGFQTIVADARGAFVTRERFADADELVVAWPDEAARRIGLQASDSVVVMTHDPKLDEPAILAAIGAGCGYVGAMGSRRTQQARRERLRRAGLEAKELERLRAPIGLDLGGRDPAETALAILAEVVAVRHGATAAPMSAREGRRAEPLAVG
jgi:xanthine dehydrogenase accessory factor